jgi:hypothetical protein
MPDNKKSPRREQADRLLLMAIDSFDSDPNGSMTLMRALTLATISQALLMQESIDATIELDFEADDEDEKDKGDRLW